MGSDLKTNFCGIEFKNPVIVPAGVHGRDGDVMRATGESGVAGICTKTIVSQPATDVLPCFSAISSGMVNSVFGSDKSAEYWFTEGISRAREGRSRVIANLAGFTPGEAADLAAKAESAGAEMIMLPTHCPHMGEILCAMYPDMPFPEPKLADLTPMKESVRLMKRAVDIPIVVKLSGTFFNIVRQWAEGVSEAGADGIACSDALGPALSIDIRTGEPALGGPRGVGGLTGAAIMPITLRMVLEAAMTVDLPVIGIGGASSAEDVIRYVMAGATLVGVCTAGHIAGEDAYSRIIEKLPAILEKYGYGSLDEIRGLTIRRIKRRKQRGMQAVTEPVPAVIAPEACIACGRCIRACAYEAIIMEEKARVIPDRCIGCGLCVSVCPSDAIEQSYYR